MSKQAADNSEASGDPCPSSEDRTHLRLNRHEFSALTAMATIASGTLAAAYVATPTDIYLPNLWPLLLIAATAAGLAALMTNLRIAHVLLGSLFALAMLSRAVSVAMALVYGIWLRPAASAVAAITLHTLSAIFTMALWRSALRSHGAWVREENWLESNRVDMQRLDEDRDSEEER